MTKGRPCTGAWAALDTKLRSELFDRADLVFVDPGALAVELLEFVEAGIFVIAWGVYRLNFAAVVQGDHRWRGTASEGAEAKCKNKGGRVR